MRPNFDPAQLGRVAIRWRDEAITERYISGHRAFKLARPQLQNDENPMSKGYWIGSLKTARCPTGNACESGARCLPRLWGRPALGRADA